MKPENDGIMVVEIKNTDKRLGIRKGQRYLSVPYEIDPSKVVLSLRVNKTTGRVMNREPLCTQYRNEVQIINCTGCMWRQAKFEYKCEECFNMSNYKLDKE